MNPTETVPTVVIDGSNVAAGGGCRPPTLGRILATRDAVASKWPTARIFIVVDAALRHQLSPREAEELADLCRDGAILTTPAFTVGKGDAVIMAVAAKLGAPIISNDSFREHVTNWPFLAEAGRVFGVVAIDGEGVFLVERKLATCGVA
jgi:hypothetical protein